MAPYPQFVAMQENSDELLDLGILKCTVFRQIHHIPTKYIPIISLLYLHVGQNPCLLEYGIYFDYTHHGFCFVGQNPCLMDLFRTNVTIPSSEMSILMVRHTKWTQSHSPINYISHILPSIVGNPKTNYMSKLGDIPYIFTNLAYDMTQPKTI